MSVQLSDLIQHVSMGSVERAVGPGAFMVIRTGPAPEDTDEPDAGLILAVIELPDGWVSAAKGAHSVGPWGKFRARTTGTAGHFRIYANDGECCVQGRITADGDGGDVTLNILDYVPGRSGEITSFAFWKAEGQKPDRLRAKRIRILKSRARKAGIPWLDGEDPPAAGGDLKSIIDGLGLGTGLICCLDAGAAASYPGTGQTWFDLTTNNADFYLGADGSAGADDPTFNGVAGALSEAEYWATSTNEEGTFSQHANFGAQSFHQADAAFTVLAVIYMAEPDGYYVNAIHTGFTYGASVQLEHSVGTRIEINGAAASIGDAIAQNQIHFMAASFDRNGGATGIKLVLNNVAETHDVSEVGAASVEANDSTPGIFYLSPGTRLYGVAIWNTALTAANLEAIRAALKAGRFPSLYEAP